MSSGRRALGLVVGASVGEGGQALVGPGFFLQRFVEQAGRVVEAERKLLASSGVGRLLPWRDTRSFSMRHFHSILATLGIGMAVCTWGGDVAATAQAQRFDIAAQSLDEALTVFATSTGLQLLYDSSLAAGRVSSPVEGAFEPRQALALLLNGTGLTARFTSAGAVVIYAASSSAVTLSPITAVAAPVIGRRDDDRAARLYAEAVQRRIVEALSRDPTLSDADYVIAIALWVGDDGQAARAQVLRGSGDGARDLAFTTFLSRLRLDSPPEGLPQPMNVEFRVRRGR